VRTIHSGEDAGDTLWKALEAGIYISIEAPLGNLVSGPLTGDSEG